MKKNIFMFNRTIPHPALVETTNDFLMLTTNPHSYNILYNLALMLLVLILTSDVQGIVQYSTVCRVLDGNRTWMQMRCTLAVDYEQNHSLYRSLYCIYLVAVLQDWWLVTGDYWLLEFISSLRRMLRVDMLDCFYDNITCFLIYIQTIIVYTQLYASICWNTVEKWL